MPSPADCPVFDHATAKVTADKKETLGLLLMLMAFALAAAGYVLQVSPLRSHFAPTSLHFTSLHSTSLHSTALHFTSLMDSARVLQRGLEEGKKTQYELVLKCVLILISCC